MSERSAQLIEESRVIIEDAGAPTHPEALEQMLLGIGQDAESIERAAATPLIRLILQRTVEEHQDVIDALVECPPTEAAIIGVLQGRARWLAKVPHWIDEALKTARFERDLAAREYEAAEQPTID